MPTGRVKWFDPHAREAIVVARSRREYPALASDIEPKARASAAIVTFKIKRGEGVDRAFDVVLREGTRAAASKHRFGDLKGAPRPASRGRPALSRHRLDVFPNPDEAPVQTVQRWVDAVVRGDRLAALRFYVPDCLVHPPGGSTEIGRKAVQDLLDRSPLLGSDHRDIEIRDLGGRIQVSWRLTPADEARVPVSERTSKTVLRVAHGQIVEQWG